MNPKYATKSPTYAPVSDTSTKNPTIQSSQYSSMPVISCNVHHNSWASDGYCDDASDGYNKAAYNWDGGDCYPQTCKSSMKYNYGKAGYLFKHPTYAGLSATSTPIKY